MVDKLLDYVPFGVTAAVVALSIFILGRIAERRARSGAGLMYRSQATILVAKGFAVVVLILALPIGDSLRGNILSLIGIVLSAAIALSSTTFLGNAMAGVMLRAVRNFRMGDFIEVEDHFGRVCERGLFHTEIQTEHRELTTLPNLFLVTHPVKTVRSSGTVVSATVSLGYDVPHADVIACLKDAIERAEMTDGWVHVSELGDFSVVYRASGVLGEVKRLISARSALRRHMLDALHDAGIEIVSPNFMNTRALDVARKVVPQSRKPAEPSQETAAEEVVFDKADEAESLANLEAMLEKARADLAELEKQAPQEGDEDGRRQRTLDVASSRVERLERLVSARKDGKD